MSSIVGKGNASKSGTAARRLSLGAENGTFPRRGSMNSLASASSRFGGSDGSLNEASTAPPGAAIAAARDVVARRPGDDEPRARVGGEPRGLGGERRELGPERREHDQRGRGREPREASARARGLEPPRRARAVSELAPARPDAGGDAREEKVRRVDDDARHGGRGVEDAALRALRQPPVLGPRVLAHVRLRHGALRVADARGWGDGVHARARHAPEILPPKRRVRHHGLLAAPVRPVLLHARVLAEDPQGGDGDRPRPVDPRAAARLTAGGEPEPGVPGGGDAADGGTLRLRHRRRHPAAGRRRSRGASRGGIPPPLSLGWWR